MPSHTGYTQLAIIHEKQGRYAEAIRRARAAMKQGWNGDWAKRIARCEERLARQQATGTAKKPSKVRS